MGALHHALEKFCSLGQLSELITCTDVLRQWNRPCQDPITMDELKSKKHEILNQVSKSQPIPTLYDPRRPSMRIIDHESLEQLRLNLLSIDHHCAILQQLIPSSKYLKHDHTYCKPMSDETPPSEIGSPNSGEINYRCVALAEEKQQVYIELTISPERCLEIE